jgi:crotonobetainyl-CoA:carnitine CoA-transferase CaiB-like acyl-CoA transferase
MVADLSALWAGPLAARLLAEWGADVVKLEDPSRPDGFRAGAPAFYERLNRGKRLAHLSLRESTGIMAEADIVITSARPRVWEHLGVPPLRGTWVRITGYGSTGPWRERVAFGDDAAVAGGLVRHGDRPAFVGDAIADPLTGMVAAGAALAGLSDGGGRVVDVAMREVAGWLARPPGGDCGGEADKGTGMSAPGRPVTGRRSPPGHTGL